MTIYELKLLAAFIPFIGLIVIFGLILGSYYLFNPLKKKIQELGGKSNKNGEGIFSVDGRSVGLKYIAGSRNRSPELRLVTTGSFGADLTIRRETSQDKFYLQIGLNKEVDIHDQELADKFYFECDVPEFLNQLLMNIETKPQIIDILNSFSSIEITSKTCTFKQYPAGAIGDISNELITQAARKLFKFAALISPTVGNPHPELAAFKGWSVVLKCIGTMVIISGGVLWLCAGIPFRVVDDTKAWSLTAEWFLAIFSVGAYLAFMVIKGFSTSSKVFIYFCVCFGIGALLGIRYGGAFYNGYFDKSSSKQFEQMITDKYTSTSKSSTYYHVTVSPWHPGMNGWSFQVSNDIYSRVRPGKTHCLIVTKSGRLGFEWIVSETVEGLPQQNRVSSSYGNWYPLPENTGNMDPQEYSYWQHWHFIMEEGMSQRMRVQGALDVLHPPEVYMGIFDAYEVQQQGFLKKLGALDAPPRLQTIKDDILSAGADQIEFYKEYAQAKTMNNKLKFNAFSNNAYLMSCDRKLHAAYNYFKSLYPSIDKATNDAIEQRIAWYDIV